MQMNFLTQAEEGVMLKMWKLKKASVKEILEEYEEPRPAYNTTSTIIRILEKKKMVKHRKKGKGFIYEAKVSKEQYFENVMKHFAENYKDIPLEDIYSTLIAKRSTKDVFFN